MTKKSWRSYYCCYRRFSSCIKFFYHWQFCSLILMGFIYWGFSFQHSLFGVFEWHSLIYRKTLIFGFKSSYLWSKRRSEFDLISPDDVTSQIMMAATGRAVSRDLNGNTLKKKNLETHAKTYANALCHQKSHANTGLIRPKWRWRVQYKKELNQRTSAATAAIFDIIKSQRSLGKSILIFFALWTPVARGRFFRRNGRISRIVLRGIYATNELNSTTKTREVGN